MGHVSSVIEPNSPKTQGSGGWQYLYLVDGIPGVGEVVLAEDVTLDDPQLVTLYDSVTLPTIDLESSELHARSLCLVLNMCLVRWLRWT